MVRKSLTQLPVLVSDHWDWRLRAACRVTDPALFFYAENERGGSRRRRTAAAKDACHHCPVVAECLAWAMSANEAYGIWGGLTPEERETLKQPMSA